MTPLMRGLLLAAIHVAMVLSLGGKLLWDRSTYPRAWMLTEPVDPSTPLRGRYVSLQVRVKNDGLALHQAYVSTTGPQYTSPQPVRLAVINGEAVAQPAPSGADGLTINATPLSHPDTVVIGEPLAFFIPEHVADPSFRKPGEQLWVEATIPPQGPPRPIRLGVKKEGQITPLPLD